MPKIRYIFLWWILMVLSTGEAFAQGLMTYNYNVKDGLANATVYDAVQDKEGFIWFSTPTGVSKFDGKRFRNYSKKDGLTDNDVVKLAADSKGRVWFFTLNGLPSFFWNYTIHTSRNDSSLDMDAHGKYMQYMFEDYAGFIWFLNTDKHVIQYSGRKTTYDKLGAQPTNLFYFLRNDTIFKPRQPYFNLTDLKDTSSPNLKVLNESNFPLGQDAVEHIRKQSVIIVDNNLYTYRNKEVVCFFKGVEWGIKDEISNVCVDNDNLWIGTPRTLYYLKGFFRGEKKPVKLLENHYITSLLKDRDGNIWITTFGDGVYYIPYKNFYFSYFDNTNGLFSHSIFSICKDEKTGLLLVGQNAGVLNTIDTNSRFRQFNLDTTSGRNSILSILPYRQNEMLIGTDNGLFSFNTVQQKKTLLKRVNTLKDVDITPGGKIRIAAKNQVICGDDYKIDRKDELITSVTCVNESAYYIGTDRGLFYGDDATRTLKIRPTRPAVDLSIKDLKWINGELWVGTADHGIYVLRADNSLEAHLSTADKLVSDICQQLYYDSIGRLYVATNKGVSVIDVQTKKLIRNITSNDGLMSDDARGVYYQQGILYIATSNGLSYFNDAKMPVDTVPPTIYLNHVRYGDSSYLPGKQFVLMYQRKASFEVEFGAIAYDLPELVEYQYNFSSDTSSGWITTMSNIVPFPDLQPDTYQLQIRARKYRSNWSQPVVITVTILPRWYQQWWARGVLILLGLILVAFVLRDVIRRIQRAEMRKTEYNRRIAELEAKALTNQMNPHFIFNSLNSVQHLIMEKEEKQALNFLADFATLMRQMLNNSRKSFISLEEEIAFLTRYIELEKIRFANVFTYHFLLQDDLKDYTIYIPPMIIQPIVENAIKHGLAPKNGSGRLEVKLVLREDMLYCSVDDDGIGWDRANEIKSGRLVRHESTALSVIRERLQIIKSFNGNVGKLEIIDKFKSGFGNKEGTLVEILIPIVKML